MSKVIKDAIAKITRSEQFLQVFSELLSVEMERQLRATHGGENFYITKTTCLNERQERNKLIRSSYTGNNIPFLSEKFGMHPRHIRRICKKK